MNADPTPDASPSPAPLPVPEPPLPELSTPQPVVDADAGPRPVTPYPRQLGIFDVWLQQNIAPLFLIFFSLAMLVPLTMVTPRSRAPMTERNPEPALPPSPRPQADPLPSSPGSIEDALAVEKLSPMAYVIVGLTLLGLAVLFFGVVAAAVDMNARQWLKEKLTNFPRRALPALRVTDIVAVFAVFLSMGTLVATLAAQIFKPNGAGETMAVLFIANDSVMLIATAAAVWLARVRAKGTHGSFGIWPFWRLWQPEKPRSAWNDVGLGLLCYPIFLAAALLTSAISQSALRAMGEEPDKHPVIQQLQQQQELWVMVSFFVAATAGAAIFEEIFFRGVLYNVFRRYSVWLGAFLAAVIFAVVHDARSTWLSLIVLALLLTWLYERTGRLVASMTLHACNNLISLIFTLINT